MRSFSCMYLCADEKPPSDRAEVESQTSASFMSDRKREKQIEDKEKIHSGTNHPLQPIDHRA